MRYFVALNLPQEIKNPLYDLQRKTKTKEAKIHWVAKKNLHITLKFFGELKEDTLIQIKTRLKEITLKKIQVTLTKTEFFPNIENPAVIWIGLTPEEKIIKLAQKIDEETLDLVASEQRFTAHITLGRIKKISSKKNILSTLKAMNIEKISFTLDSFTLYKSTLTSQGPNYEEIETYSLSP